MSEYEWVNPYYSPEKLNLRIIAQEDTGGPYEFDMFIIWEEKTTGEIYWGADEGCSCPSPFERHKFPEDFYNGALHEAYDALDGWLEAQQGGY